MIAPLQRLLGDRQELTRVHRTHRLKIVADFGESDEGRRIQGAAGEGSEKLRAKEGSVDGDDQVELRRRVGKCSVNTAQRSASRKDVRNRGTVTVIELGRTENENLARDITQRSQRGLQQSTTVKREGSFVAAHARALAAGEHEAREIVAYHQADCSGQVSDLGGGGTPRHPAVPWSGALNA